MGGEGSVRSGFDETKLMGLQMIAQSSWRIQAELLLLPDDRYVMEELWMEELGNLVIE